MRSVTIDGRTDIENYINWTINNARYRGECRAPAIGERGPRVKEAAPGCGTYENHEVNSMIPGIILSLLITALGAIFIVVPFKRNRVLGLRIRSTYESEVIWRRKNRYFGFFLLLTGLLLLLFIDTAYYAPFLLAAIAVSFLAAYIEERSPIVTPLAIFALSLLTCLCAYSVLPEQMAIHFTGLHADGWGAKTSYLLAMAALSSIIFLASVFVARFREDALPIMNGTLLLLLSLNAFVIAAQFYGEQLIAFGYLSLVVLVVFIAHQYLTKVRQSGVMR